MEKSSYVLGSELWEIKFNGLLALVEEYIVEIWEIQKHKLTQDLVYNAIFCLHLG